MSLFAAVLVVEILSFFWFMYFYSSPISNSVSYSTVYIFSSLRSKQTAKRVQAAATQNPVQIVKLRIEANVVSKLPMKMKDKIEKA